ncbi:MAG TPA: pyridoxamine 5'-phosphate oxidase [Polyangiales bacterium]|nr:pyridoxamine 5'-phosphate oxidase [Polyangiales bacterium]
MSEYSDSAYELDPITWFARTIARAAAVESFDATRAALATSAGEPDAPNVRFVLVKQADARGFVFFTNYDSDKARELAVNPRAALAFHWEKLGEQVRVRGVVERVSAAESDAYFATRPRGSQLGAWASAQSRPIDDRAALDAQLAEVAARFAGVSSIPRPPHWGGLRLVPDSIEFWRNRDDRLHDRFRFTRNEAGWSCQRLQP